MSFQKASNMDLSIVKGDTFFYTLTLYENLVSRKGKIANINPGAGTVTIRGSKSSDYTIGAVFQITSNTNPSANKLYTVTSVSEASNTTILSVGAPTENPVAACDPSINTFTVASNVRLDYFNGQKFFLTNNTGNVESNKEYTVLSAYLSGNETIIQTVEDVPSGTDATGTLSIPTLPARSANNGSTYIASNRPIDVRGYTITSSIRSGIGETPAIHFSVDNTTNGENGEVRLSLTGPAQTSKLDIGKQYYYDILVNPNNGTPAYRLPRPGPGLIRVFGGIT